MKLYERVCAIMLVRMGFNAGQDITEIASLAGRAPATIRRWLRTSGLVRLKRAKSH